jgi:hypothetical protein
LDALQFPKWKRDPGTAYFARALQDRQAVNKNELKSGREAWWSG